MYKLDLNQQENEIERLNVQEDLFSSYERPAYQKVFAKQRDFVLDIGSNDGRKTIKRFSNTNAKKIIGIDLDPELINSSQANCLDNRFSFICCDTEDENFASNIQNIMKEKNIPAFDVINLSFVLMHIKDNASLLTQLRSLLSEDGILMLIDTNDDLSCINPDEGGYFATFKQLLSKDPYAGDRRCGAKLPEILSKCGYKNISLEKEKLVASPLESQKKESMFACYCSFLEGDIELLLKEDPTNSTYLYCRDWLKDNYDTLLKNSLSDKTKFTLGVSVITCTRN